MGVVLCKCGATLSMVCAVLRALVLRALVCSGAALCSDMEIIVWAWCCVSVVLR